MIGLLLILTTLGAPSPKPAPPATKPKGTSSVTVDAANLEVLNKPQEARRAIWKGKVVAHRDEVILKCDRMEAELTADDRVENATCDGHVEATKGDSYVAGKHADFDNVRGILVVTGEPHGNQGETHVEGKKITFFVDENVMHVEESHLSLPPNKMDREHK
jgi:lipopolysaccharide transport protein LptA